MRFRFYLKKIFFKCCQADTWKPGPQYHYFVVGIPALYDALISEKGKGVDATQEMIVLGISNVAGSFLGSMPISGSFTRSAINNSSGVKTPFGGFFTGKSNHNFQQLFDKM